MIDLMYILVKKRSVGFWGGVEGAIINPIIKGRRNPPHPNFSFNLFSGIFFYFINKLTPLKLKKKKNCEISGELEYYFLGAKNTKGGS